MSRSFANPILSPRRLRIERALSRVLAALGILAIAAAGWLWLKPGRGHGFPDFWGRPGPMFPHHHPGGPPAWEDAGFFAGPEMDDSLGGQGGWQGSDEELYGHLREVARRIADSGRLKLPIDPDNGRVAATWVMSLMETKRQLDGRRRLLRERAQESRQSGQFDPAEAAELHRQAEELLRDGEEVRRQALAAFVHLEHLEKSIRDASEAPNLTPADSATLRQALKLIGQMRQRRQFWREMRRELERFHREEGVAWFPPVPREGGYPPPPYPPPPRGPEGRPYPRPHHPGGPFPPPPPSQDWGPQGGFSDAPGLRDRLEFASETRERLDLLRQEIHLLREETRLLREEVRALREGRQPAAFGGAPSEAK